LKAKHGEKSEEKNEDVTSIIACHISEDTGSVSRVSIIFLQNTKDILQYIFGCNNREVKSDAQFEGKGKKKKCLYVPNVVTRTSDKNKVLITRHIAKRSKPFLDFCGGCE
jgi:hypothetical protein